MKNRIHKSLRRIFALLLCISVLAPMFPAPTYVHAATHSWMTEVLALYPGGTKSEVMEYDCGNGVTRGGEKSYLSVVTGTTAAHFDTFKASMKAAGFTETFTRTVASNSSGDNLFGGFLSPSGNYKVHAYHFPGYGETRIIVDTQQDTVEGFVYEPQTGVNVTPKLVMWGMPMSPNGYGESEKVDADQPYRRNCGGMVVIRMPDNSLFINDGGDVQQWDDQTCDDFVDFCRELTGTKAGQKIVVNTWFLSHAHIDHYRGFHRLMNMEHDQFDLKNIMYSIDVERFGTDCDITAVMNLLADFYPEARYYKPHTGETIDIAGVSVEVIYALEDRYLPNASGKLITDTKNKGGTYRDFMYKSDGSSDFNDTSTVVRVTFKNGINSILYGDMNLADQMLREVYAPSVLKTDIMLMPHHGHNDHKELVELADSKVYLYTQHKNAVYGPDNDVTTLDMYGTYRESVRDKFITMFKDKGMYVPAGTEDVDFDIFWAGNETVTIDVVAMRNLMTGASTAQYYTTRPAPTFEYTGWGVMDLSSKNIDREMLSSVGAEETLPVIELSTHTIRYEAVASGGLIDNKRYIIMHKGSKNIMTYEPVAVTAGRPNMGGSLRPVTQTELDTTDPDIYYVHTNGHVYLDHSNRDRAMWILSQESNSSTALVKSTWKPALYGGTTYGELWLHKGIKDEYDANGVKTVAHNGNYWYSVYGQDGASPTTQYRFLDPRYVDEEWVKTSEPTGTDATTPKRRYLIEDLGNGDFLVYWRSASGATVSFLTCDENGVWGIKRFTADETDYFPPIPEAGSAELEAMKLKFYVYNQFTKDTDIKKIEFTGYRTFNVHEDATRQQILDCIQEKIALKDTSRWNIHVPCSGTTPMVGRYHLKLDEAFDASGADKAQYTVDVVYRNDDHTDVKIATLTLNVGYQFDGDQDLVVCGHEVHDTTGTCVRCGQKVDHTYWTEVTEPGCIADGRTTHTCSVCGHSYTENVVDALGHQYQTEVTPPTCVTGGYTTYTCSRCGESKQEDQVPATGHEWKEATCTEARYCLVCGTTDSAPVGHSYEAVITSPTCTVGGYTTFTCTICGHSFKGNEKPALEHDYKKDVVDPECLTDGYTLYTCTRCGDSYKDAFQDALGHSWSLATCTEPASCTVCGQSRGEALGHTFETVVTPPTCTDVGRTVNTCTVCGHSETEDETPALGHSYTSEVVPVGCLTDGYTLHTCTVCGHSYKDAFQFASGHSWSGPTCSEPASCTACGASRGAALGHAYEATVVAPSCQTDGYTLHTCTRCGDSYKDEFRNAQGHTWAEATCTAAARCTVCGQERGESLGHIYKTMVTAPSCTEAGYTTYTCSVCGDSYKGDTVAALGHSYSGGSCTRCGATEAGAPTDPGLTLKYPTLSFEDEIFYNVYFTVTDTSSVAEMGLMLLSSRNDAATIEDAIGTVPGYITNGTVYMVRSESVAAAYLGDTVYFKIYAKLTDGSYAYSTAGGYNAKAYASSILGGNNTTEMKALVVAMLNYGAEAQKYFGHNTDKLVDASLTEAQKALVAAYDETMVDDIVKADSGKIGGFVRNNANFKSLYPSVSFDGAFAINFYCTPAITVDSGMTLYWWDAEDYAALDRFTLGNATGKMLMTVTNGQYWGEVAGIAAKDMDKTYYVSCVFKSGGSYVTTGIIPYSLGKYCEGKAATNGDPQQTFAQATAVYGYYAKNYFASIA